MGTTGAMGYHVPAADQRTNIKLKGRFLTECMKQTAVVRIHKKFRVPKKIEELICVQTGSNAIPGNNGGEKNCIVGGYEEKLWCVAPSSSTML